MTDPLASHRLAVVSALLDGDPARAYDMVNGLLAQGITFDRVLFDVLTPVQRDLGRRWLDGDYRIAEEHAATAATEVLLGLLIGSFDQPDDAPHVVVAAAEGDLHSMPGRMIAAYLVYEGYRVTHLGASVPATDLEQYLAEESPDLLVLTCAMSTHLVGAQAVIGAAHAAGVPVIAGGLGFGMDGGRAEALGADAWASDPKEIVALLADVRDWTIDSTLDDEIGRRPASIVQRRTQIVADTLRSLDVADSGTWPTADDVELMIDGLAATMLLDDPGVLREVLEWQSQAATRQGSSEFLVAADALKAAAVAVDAAAGPHVDQAMRDAELVGRS